MPPVAGFFALADVPAPAQRRRVGWVIGLSVSVSQKSKQYLGKERKGLCDATITIVDFPPGVSHENYILQVDDTTEKHRDTDTLSSFSLPSRSTNSAF